MARDNLPNGWTQESVDKFWDTLTGDKKHKVTECMKKMEGKVDNTGAFCGSLGSAVGYRAASIDSGAKSALIDFVDYIKEVIDKHYKDSFPSLDQPEISISWGNRYAKIVEKRLGNTSVFGFVDLTNGNILMAASWKAPAKGVRGNIYDKSTWKKAVTPYGMAYLRSASVMKVAARWMQARVKPAS